VVGIYKITNLCNGKNYIGQSVDIERRWREHKCPSMRNKNIYIQNAFKKYGIENFDFEVLQECTKEELNELEIKYITELKTQGKAEYNIAAGGSGNSNQYKTEEEMKIIGEKISKAKIGKKMSEESKRKMSETRKGRKVSDETKEKIRNSNLGRKFSDETKEKIRKLATGRKHTEETKEKIRKAAKNISPETREKLSKAAKSRSPEVIEKIRKSATGRKHTEETKEKIRRSKLNMSDETKEKIRKAAKNISPETREKMRQKKMKKVVCIETGIIYESIKTAAKIIGIPSISCGISDCLGGRAKTTGGCHWRDFDPILDDGKPILSYTPDLLEPENSNFKKVNAEVFKDVETTFEDCEKEQRAG
jgi:group I intron endonuclease